jgi:hypothetical protein
MTLERAAEIGVCAEGSVRIRHDDEPGPSTCSLVRFSIIGPLLAMRGDLLIPGHSWQLSYGPSRCPRSWLR